MNRLLSTISLSKRAGKLLMGFDQVKDAVRLGDIAIVLTASDLSEKSRKGIDLVCKAANTPSFTLPVTMDELWFELGKRTGILAVTDPGFAGKLQTMLSRETENKEEFII